MNIPNRTTRVFLGIATVVSLVIVSSCQGKKGDRNNRGPFDVLEISTGSTPIYPYRIRKADTFGQPTNDVIEINTEEDLKKNVSGNNLVLPVGIFPLGAPQLPDGNPGNQFFKIRFSHDLDPLSILSTAPSAVTNSYLTTAISLLAYDSNTEVTTILQGRAFVGGETVYNDGAGSINLVKVVEDDGSGGVQLIPGFPASLNAGFPRGFTNASELVSQKTMVFVADTDDDLSTFESFPEAVADNTLMQLEITNAVLDTGGRILRREVSTATTVGTDNRPPEVMGFSSGSFDISPGNGANNVNPTTPIVIRFNKPVQPTDVGAFLDKTNLVPTGGGIKIAVSIAARNFDVIYYADPLSVGDFRNYQIIPAYNLPGSHPTAQNQTRIDLTVNSTVIRDLSTVFLGSTVSTFFTTGQGPGIVNAPIAPDAIYVGMVGSRPGVKIVDLNGFGQTTGGYSVDPTGVNPPVFDWRNTTRFQFNPNIGAPGLEPNLSKPTDFSASGLDAGSPGVFRLVQDSAGETLLLGAPHLGSVTDIHIGTSLDTVFNNESLNVNASRVNLVDFQGAVTNGNSFSAVPHPNPPPLIFPPPNPGSAIFGQEPTAAFGACTANPINLLVAGNPDGPPGLGVFGHLSELFTGPTAAPGSPPAPTPACPFSHRQQIGHFLYVLDADNKQIVVVNSNRMTVLDTIALPDPVDMAMSPNLRRLAVSNFASGTISLIDINPFSPNFHTVVAETRVAPGPGEIVWQPDGEDILVVHPRESALSIVNGTDFQTDKIVTGFLSEPIGLSVTHRNQGGGNTTGLYFAYILNRNGTIAVFESGPDGVNGIGFNDIVGTVADINFRNPKSISNDLTSTNGGAYIAHVDEFGNGVVSRLEMTTSPGQQQLNPNSGGFLQPPTFRQKEWGVTQTYGGFSATNPTRDLLAGQAPGEVAADEMINGADLADQVTPRNSIIPMPPTAVGGKGTFKTLPTGQAVPIAPRFIFIALTDRGAIDVFDISTAERVRTIDLGGTPAVLGSYWRQ